MHLHERAAQWKGCGGNVAFALLDEVSASNLTQ
jgi:hypothetical protein